MEDLIRHIASAPKSTPVQLYLRQSSPVSFPGCREFSGSDGCKLIFGQWPQIEPVLSANRQQLEILHIHCDRRNSAVPLAELLPLQARIEPGAIIRQPVTIGKDAVIMMGAIVNIGASVGEGTMVDMGAVLGARATVGRRCHIGAGAVLAGVLEPASATPVIIEDGVLIGANAVVLEGIRIGAHAVVAAGAVVTKDVLPGTVVAGCPARFIKKKDEKTAGKTALTDGLR